MKARVPPGHERDRSRDHDSPQGVACAPLRVRFDLDSGAANFTARAKKRSHLNDHVNFYRFGSIHSVRGETS